jgi:hypothetical protein
VWRSAKDARINQHGLKPFWESCRVGMHASEFYADADRIAMQILSCEAMARQSVE